MAVTAVPGPEDRTPWTLAPGLAPFAAVGVAAIVAGGLVAAVTRPTGWEVGSWVSAYLVLVTGVGQIGLGAGQVALAAAVPTRRRTIAQLALLNAGSALVVGGTLASQPIVVTLGGLILAVGLATFLVRPRNAVGPAWLRWGHLGLVTLILVSVPVGLALSWVRG